MGRDAVDAEAAGAVSKVLEGTFALCLVARLNRVFCGIVTGGGCVFFSGMLWSDFEDGFMTRRVLFYGARVDKRKLLTRETPIWRGTYKTGKPYNAACLFY